MSKIAVVTGSGPGMEPEVPREFARSGYDVALLSRDVERLERASEAVRSHGRRALSITMNAANKGAMARATARELGPINIWFNTARTVTPRRLQAYLPMESIAASNAPGVTLEKAV